ncbi:hypothetical protein L596_028066 [Steinernema carpocapsae]|uniref:Uncharacterized protein n=1 Tax=Steinernema carpocapsae TaxID=34508 RepID=A0A4U5LXB9_STECR|nr:hypothetical protein L596_028066 [Steinernema carpocapsae]
MALGDAICAFSRSAGDSRRRPKRVVVLQSHFSIFAEFPPKTSDSPTGQLSKDRRNKRSLKTGSLSVDLLENAIPPGTT